MHHLFLNKFTPVWKIEQRVEQSKFEYFIYEIKLWMQVNFLDRNLDLYCE